MQFLLLLGFVSCSLGSKEVTVWPSASPGCYWRAFAMPGNAGCHSAAPRWIGTMGLLPGNGKKPADCK